MSVVNQKIARANLAALTRKAKAAGKDLREICGVIVDNGHFLQLVEVRNKLKRPCGFWLHVGDCKAVERASKVLGNAVVGTFHSHILSGPKPGASDLAGAQDGDLMLVIDSLKGESRLWRARSGRIREVPFVLI